MLSCKQHEHFRSPSIDSRNEIRLNFFFLPLFLLQKLTNDHKILPHLALRSCSAISVQHLNVTSHGIAGICFRCCVFMYRKNTFEFPFQGAVHLQPAMSLSAISNGYLMPTWRHLVSCDEANVFSRWGDIVKALERSPGFDWQALSQKMRSGGSHTAKRIYYPGWQGVLSQCVSAVSHLALSVSPE